MREDFSLKKKKIRKKILEIRNNIDKDKKIEYDKNIFHFLKNLDGYKSWKNIFIYICFGSEIDTKKLILDMLKENKNIYVPKIVKKEMILIKIDSLDNLELNKFNILEPKGEKNEINKEDLDLIIIPGVVFDKDGNRIGYGGGFYDRYLKDCNKKVEKIALAYSNQVLEKIITENHDLKVDCIITEKNIYNIKKPSKK